jgi:pimeloyl-ACP methyl ester carboxylesterase
MLHLMHSRSGTYVTVPTEAWKAGVPDVRVEIIPECGHAVTADKGDACAATILSFLARS